MNEQRVPRAFTAFATTGERCCTAGLFGSHIRTVLKQIMVFAVNTTFALPVKIDVGPYRHFHACTVVSAANIVVAHQRRYQCWQNSQHEHSGEDFHDLT
ncbi:hypothetical protein J6590_038582 [Homalodisca vitripennis]|nr:hypothetical protein J6590_038582 [Homalodisca vitripennis]